ncbi:MAG: hypothetical protein KDB27_02125 [Planctomycetales bacterium]|nr:hypothetical protein [Planctomycetales bacterium]
MSTAKRTLISLLVCTCANQILAQPPQPAEEMVQLNFPAEVEIKVLIDYVSTALDVRIIYDEQTVSKRISVKSSTPIPKSSLLSVLNSALKMKGLVLADAEAPGWKRIIQADRMPQVAPSIIPPSTARDRDQAEAVTESFQLNYVDPQKVEPALAPLLTQPGANSIVLPESRTIIVTDYAANLVRIRELIEMLDRPKPTAAMEIVSLRFVDAKSIGEQVTQILQSRLKAEGRLTPSVDLIPDTRSNKLLLIGNKVQIEAAKQIIKTLDVPLGLSTKTYSFEHVSASRIDSLVKDLLDPESGKRMYRSSIDEEENLLVATTTEDIHKQIVQLKETRDKTPRRGRSPMRFYKVKNLPVRDLLQTIRSIEQQAVSPTEQQTPTLANPQTGRFDVVQQPGVLAANGPATPSGPNAAPADPGFEIPPPPSYRGPESQGPLLNADTAGSESTAGSLLGKARVTADVHTNNLIVIAEPAVQRLYAELIEKLDQPLPQVLIESRVVIIDTSDNFSLGVEFSSGDRDGGKRLLTFSSFGLSEVDPVSGALSLVPGLGFNGTLVDPDVADVVVRALTTHNRSRVTSAPRVLVNDNAEGQLTSVAEVPFNSINASDTVATTSFAGFAQAGTTITVTPRISDADKIQLDFGITLNTFTSTGGDGVPPRQTDEIRSQVTIPDGYTVIVGGLNRTANSWTFTSMPGIDKVPLLRYLGGNESRDRSSSSMFIFLKPIILRDDKHKDLRFLSERDINCAGVCPDFPKSEPIWIKAPRLGKRQPMGTAARGYKRR